MNEFKVGDKVETPFGVGVIESIEKSFNNISYADITVLFTLPKDIYGVFKHKIELPIIHVKPYKSAHEKLIDMGIMFENDFDYANNLTFIKLFTEESKPHCIARLYVVDKSIAIYDQDMSVTKIIMDYFKEFLELNEKGE